MVESSSLNVLITSQSETNHNEKDFELKNMIYIILRSRSPPLYLHQPKITIKLCEHMSLLLYFDLYLA